MLEFVMAAIVIVSIFSLAVSVSFWGRPIWLVNRIYNWFNGDDE